MFNINYFNFITEYSTQKTVQNHIFISLITTDIAVECQQSILNFELTN
jgi:hypothetical protein